MKKLIFGLLFFIQPIYAQDITLHLNDQDVQVVEIYEGKVDVVLKSSFDEKVKRLKERLISETVKDSIKKSEIIPAGEDAIIIKGIEEKKKPIEISTITFQVPVGMKAASKK